MDDSRDDYYSHHNVTLISRSEQDSTALHPHINNITEDSVGHLPHINNITEDSTALLPHINNITEDSTALLPHINNITEDSTALLPHIDSTSLSSSPSSSLSWNTPLTSPVHRSPIPSTRGQHQGPQHSDRAVQLNDLYMDTKTGMLGIIEEGLQLKLQIQTIKDQFLQLVNDFGDLEQKEMERTDSRMARHQLPQAAVHALKASGTTISSGRARVRALYEARKARIRQRRAALQDASDLHRHSQSSKPPVESFASVEEDKENMFLPLCGSTPMGASRGPATAASGASSVAAPLTEANLKNLSQMPTRTMTWSIKKFLTPIKEEHLEQSSFGVQGNKSKKSFQKSRSKDCSRPTKQRFGSDNVTLRAPERYSDFTESSESGAAKDNFNVKTKKTKRRSCREVLGFDPSFAGANEHRTNKRHSVPTTFGATKYEDFDATGNPYTSKLIKDISQISQVSSPHEQVSSANLTGAFHSTFNYPLHSTMNNPLHSHLNLSDIKSVDQTDTFSDNEDTFYRHTDSQTAVSEPTSHYRRVEKYSPFSNRRRRAMDDSYMDYQLSSVPSPQSSKKCIKTRKSFSPSSYKTPTKKPQAKLCREHGLHPTFGGPCIFATENSAIFDDISSPELDVDENDNTPKISMNTTDMSYTQHKVNTMVTETDCDSSYLSECVDDHHFSSHGFSEVDEYTAMYDSKQARMRMLKRQTGQAELKHVKNPVGLSESDLLFDISKKQLSMEATRASMPDLSGLSTLASTEMDEEDESESTLHASSPKKSRTGSLHLEREDFLSPNRTLVDADTRALSVSTNEDSPESNTGISVPVNSPNITDSTGSSSRPTDNNYDFVEPGVPPDPPPSVQTLNDSSVIDNSMASISNKKPTLMGCLRPQITLKSHRNRASSKQSHSSHHHHHHHHQPSPSRKKSKRKSSKMSLRRAVSERAPSVSQHSTTGRTAISCYSRSTHRSRPLSSQDWDSGCSVYSRPHSRQLMISDNTGQYRNIVQSSTAGDLPQDRKKALAKKLKHFSNSFYSTTSAGNLGIETLAHF